MKHLAKKRFGQNFLQDESVIARIVACIQPQAEDALVEVGPGLGALTRPLQRACPTMVAIELDRDVLPRLPTQLQVLQQDVLTVDFTALAQQRGRKLRIVGNLPYNISSPLLLLWVAQAQAIADVHAMLQKEVVDRLVAQPQTAAYGRLSVVMQWCFAIELLFTVDPSSFAPAPKVMSAVFRMRPKSDAAPLVLAQLETITRIAFSQRRKILRHTLGAWLVQQGYGGDFDDKRRAEEVPVTEYIALAQALQAHAFSNTA